MIWTYVKKRRTIAIIFVKKKHRMWRESSDRNYTESRKADKEKLTHNPETFTCRVMASVSTWKGSKRPSASKSL